MNIKRIGLIGGSGVVIGSGVVGGGDSGLWSESTDYGLNSTNANRDIMLGSSVHIGTDGPVRIGSNVYIGTDVNIESGFDSRKIDGGAIWGVENKYVYVNNTNFNIKLGKTVNIGSDCDIYIGKTRGIEINTGSSFDAIFIGSGVYIEQGFDSRNISGGGDGNSLWKVQNDILVSKDSNRSIALGSRVSIGIDNYVELGENGIVVSNISSSKVKIGSEVIICKEQGEALTIGNDGILVYNHGDNRPTVSINDKVNIGYDVTLGDNVFIQKNFNTQRYIDSNNDLIPACIPTDSSLNTSRQLSVNIIPQSNGNIKIGNTLFMPATPSGDPMHYAYETAGAKYNGTADFIVKDAPWKDMVDTIEDKAKWGFDIVDASQVKQMTIGGTTYNYVQTTRTSPEGTTEPRYFLVGQASDGTWVEDETKVLHLPGHWYLNGLGDINNAEMRRMLEEKEVKYRWDKIRGGQNIKSRTIIPQNTVATIDMIPSLATPYGIHCESICVTFIGDFIANEHAKALSVFSTGASNKTRYIQTCKDASGTPFNIARVVSFIKLTQNCNISNVPLLSKPSILYTINTATPTTPITITLHANRYAQLSEDADIIAALEAKNTSLEGTGGRISLVSA